MGGEALCAGAVDLIGRDAFGDLFQELVDAVAECVLEVAHPAEDRIGVDAFLEVARRIERRLAPHVLDDKAPVGSGDFAAFHGMPAFDVVGGGQPADRAVLEAHAEVRGGDDFPSRRSGAEALHGLDVAAEVAHDVHRVGIERLDHVVGRTLRRIFDPQRHVDEQQMPDAAFILPLLCQIRGGREAVVEVDGVAHAHPPRRRHHRFALFDLVADGLFAEDVTARFERLHRRQIVVARIFVAARGDAAQIGLERRQHGWRIVERGDAQARRRCVCPLAVDVAHADQLGERVFLVNSGMAIADGPHADDTDS